MAAPSPRHIPVLLEEVLGILRPDRPGVFVDGTLGLGGHASAILDRGHPDLRLIGFDRDEESLEEAARRLEPHGDRVELVHLDYRRGAEYLKKKAWRAGSRAGFSTWESVPCIWISRKEGSPSSMRGLWT